jgi:predicted transposase/invertase (TIGR01784 family)
LRFHLRYLRGIAWVTLLCIYIDYKRDEKRSQSLARAREKALRDEISKLDSARREGEEKGEKKGRTEGEESKAIQVAKNLLMEEDMDVSKIARITGLPASEIEKLKE